MSVCNFNYKYLKDNATPGSWRRGYEYHQKAQVQDIELVRNVLKAKVKGNFKSFYETELNFKKGSVEPKCSCPLKEKWCKHAIAVGLKAIEEHTYEEFLSRRFKVEPDYSDEITPNAENPQGGYTFHFNPKRRQNFFSILVMDRSTGKVIRDLEAVLKLVIAAQKADPNFELNSSQKVELALFQMLLKNSRLDKKAGWYDVPIAKFDGFFQLLSKADEVIDGKTKRRIVFTNDEWHLTLSVNFSMVGNVLLALYWKRPDKDDLLPFEEVRYFSRQLKWGRYKNIIFPTNIAISALPQNLIKSTFTDIKDADGAKFLYEELPKLRQMMDCEVAPVIDKLTLEQKPPLNIVTMGLDYDGALKASLEFDYDGTRVPYSKSASKSPYVTIKKPKEDLLYWVRRNINHEEETYRMLLACKFAPMQTNNLALEKENAIDFYNYYLKQAGEGWKFEEKDDMSFFKLAEQPFELCADIDFATNTTDSFEMSLYGKVGEDIMPFDDVHSLILEGNKYIRVKNEGFAALPDQDFFSLMKSFNTFDVYRNDENKFIVKTYRAGLISEMQNQGMKLKMSRKFNKFWKQISTFSTMDNATLPKGVHAEFREYQAKGFSWLWFLYQYGLNGILADDMGLGKTLQALALIQKAKEKNKQAPNLVVCPTSVVFNWESEIQKFAPNLKCLTLTGPDRKELFKKIPKHDVIITSYALVRRDIECLKKYDFRYVILDESQNIKNAESITAQSVKQLNCQHKLALSGTPIENRLEELWSIFDFLMPGFLFNQSDFNYRYVNPIVERQDKAVEKRLKSQIYPFILRRMKRDVAKDLPDKVENIAYCELTPEQKDFYLDVLDSTKEELFKSIEQNGLEKNRLSIFSALLRLRQICCHPQLYDKENLKGIKESGKFEYLKGMLEEIISEGHRVLLFSQFVDMLDLVKEWLIKSGIKHEYLTGKTKNRQEVVERFNEDDSIPIFLISLKAGGTGLNLTGADYVIHYDPWWNPAVEDQATDRAYRIGQTKKVFVYRLITKGTVEEKIQKLKQRKRNLVDSVISVDRNIGKTLTYADLQDIFSID
ncbi:MAG: DEAD/DEAH box helicase [Candidatus Gastranaerophilales bacterium]|nr:DEAD/DEAH box helicase [Candidatus Gastranaerophilales bacterium]